MVEGRWTVNPVHKKLSGFESHPPHFKRWNDFILILEVYSNWWRGCSWKALGRWWAGVRVRIPELPLIS